MRSDMKKLLCERPRNHDSWGSTYKTRKNTPLDELPFRESMSRKMKGTKELNEYLAPLRRYINKQVGRPWNKVYSEICQQINGGNPVETHILEHIDGYVETKVQRVSLEESETGLISQGGISGDRYRFKVLHGELYVDPDSGIIKRAKSLIKRKKVVKETLHRKISNTQLALKDNGVWYIHNVSSYKTEDVWRWCANILPEDRITSNKRYPNGYHVKEFIVDGVRMRYLPMNSDIDKYFSWPNTLFKVMGSNKLISVSKRQMNSKELRSNNLKNDR